MVATRWSGAPILEPRTVGGLVGWGALAALTSFLVIVGVGSLTAVLWMLGSVAIVVIRFRRGADSPPAAARR